MGVAISKALNAPLVLDFRDPWTQAPVLRERRYPFGVPKALLVALEGACLRQAAAVSYVYESNLHANARAFGCPSGSLWEVIPNGFEPDAFEGAPPATFERPTVLYAGACYGGRSLVPVLEALEMLIRSERPRPSLVFHGELDHASKQLLMANPMLGSTVSCEPRIGMRELAPKMLGAHSLLLLTGPEHRHALAAKVLDYFVAERPILAVGPGDAVAKEVIQATNTGTWVDTEAGTGALADALERIATGPVDYQPNVDAVEQWSADSTARLTAKLLNRVVRMAAGRGQVPPRVREAQR